MADVHYPRSPRETMCGWMHLPRLIDKIRLQLAGKLPADYLANFGKGFDALWLETAEVGLEELTEVVRRSLTDGEVADWVRERVRKPEEAKRTHAQGMLAPPDPADAERVARFQFRKQQAGLAGRNDVRSFVDIIDADEKRM